jgi:hypothetical protein
MTRQPEIKPATAYDYRRYIELVQVLSHEGDYHLMALCEAWGVKPVMVNNPDYHSPMDNRLKIHYLGTIHRLAQAAIEYHRHESVVRTGDSPTAQEAVTVRTSDRSE